MSNLCVLLLFSSRLAHVCPFRTSSYTFLKLIAINGLCTLARKKSFSFVANFANLLIITTIEQLRTALDDDIIIFSVCDVLQSFLCAASCAEKRLHGASRRSLTFSKTRSLSHVQVQLSIYSAGPDFYAKTSCISPANVTVDNHPLFPQMLKKCRFVRLDNRIRNYNTIYYN